MSIIEDPIELKKILNKNISQLSLLESYESELLLNKTELDAIHQSSPGKSSSSPGKSSSTPDKSSPKNKSFKKSSPSKGKNPEEIRVEMVKLEERRDFLKNELEREKILIHIKDQEIELEKKLKKINKYIKHEEHLNVIKVVIYDVSTGAMNEVIDSLNTVTNKILAQLFEDVIYVELDTHKNLKGGGEKMQVNLKIIYDDFVYNDIYQLSGGELNRVSFALTLAVTKMTGSKILLLDECMSSLNEELREKCLDVLNEYFEGVTVIHICHEIVKGSHDEVIELA
jgi:DNA repair exonuclease SbcCD ATPase subunit